MAASDECWTVDAELLMCNTVKIPDNQSSTLSEYLLRFARSHMVFIMHSPRASGLATPAIRRPIAPEIAYRADIDGLRAVAVLSVIGFHASPKFITGGFIGVDVFFVISGYLISSLILSGLKDGSFNSLDFYARRARRIFPALTVVLVFAWVIGLFFLVPTDFVALSKHIGAGAAFAANIITYFEVGYFDAPANTKPLLHLWSLGVEEQFYLLWPAVLVFAWKRGFNVLTTACVLAIVSFAANMFCVTHQAASAAFYLPHTRLWELLLGAALAALT